MSISKKLSIDDAIIVFTYRDILREKEDGTNEMQINLDEFRTAFQAFGNQHTTNFIFVSVISYAVNAMGDIYPVIESNHDVINKVWDLIHSLKKKWEKKLSHFFTKRRRRLVMTWTCWRYQITHSSNRWKSMGLWGSNVGQPAPPPWLEDLSDEDQARIESVRQGEIERALIVEGTDFWLCEYQPTGLTGTNGKKWGYTARHYRQRRGTGWLIVGGLVLSLATTLWALSERSAYWQVQAKFDEKQNAFTTTQNNLVETKKNLENANNKIAENENKIKTLTAKIDEINSTSCNYNGIKNRILGVFNCFSFRQF